MSGSHTELQLLVEFIAEGRGQIYTFECNLVSRLTIRSSEKRVHFTKAAITYQGLPTIVNALQ